MHIRLRTLWRVPVFCLISSYVSFYVTVYLGSAFFVVRTMGPTALPMCLPTRSGVQSLTGHCF